MAVFDSEAKNYDNWYNTKLGSFIDEIETSCAFGILKIEKGMKILDIGCGTGNFSIKLAKEGCKVVAIDVSEEMLEVSKEKAQKEGLDIIFYNMDVYNLDFKDNLFDAAISMAAFEFIKEQEKAFNEIIRVVKENGQILIGTINRDSKWGKLYLSEEFQKNTVFKHANFKNIEDLKMLNPKKLVNIEECLFIPPNIEEDKITIENEFKLSKTESGGFICALWKK